LSWKILKSKTLFLGATIAYFCCHLALFSHERVRGGFIIITNPNEAYNITGDWLSFKEKSYSGYPNLTSDPWEPIQVPGIWNRIDINHRGTIWYKLEFRIYRSLAGKDMGLMTPNIALANSVYLNGKYIGGSGSFDSNGIVDFKSTQMKLHTLPKELILPKGKNILLIRVGSVGGVGGFNLADIYLGDKEAVQEKYFRNLLWNTILVAIFVFVGIYHMMMFIARKKDAEYLYYSLLCFTLALYNLSFSTLSYWVYDNFWFYYFGTCLSVTIFPVWLLLFIHKFLEFNKRFFAKFLIGSSIFLIIITITMNVLGDEQFGRYNSTILPVLLMLVAISILYPIYLIYFGIKEKKSGSWIILIGYFVFAMAVTNDMLNYLRVLNSVTFVEAGFLAFITSISFSLAVKFAEVHNQLEYLTKNLSDEVGIRTKELSQTNARLMEIDRMKTNFFANVTHELRTPLTLSLLPLEKAIQNTKNPETLALLETSQRNNIRLLRLINDLLDFAKIEAGSMDLRLAPTNLTYLVKGLVSTFQISAESKNIKVKLELQESVNTILDPEKTEKILSNLLSNAYKFTPSNGEIIISLSEIQYQQHEYVRIQVKDTGIGIPDDKISMIFDRFHQVDMGKERVFEGTGIGLSLVKELTELQNGFVEVQSKLGEGSEFSIYIPVIRDEALIINSDSDSNINKLMESESFSNKVLQSLPSYNKLNIEDSNDPDKKTILIVEDNLDMLYLLKNLLSKDYNLISASNGEEGIHIAEANRPALILSDVMMPILNGFQMTRKLKDHNQLKNTPVVLLTALNDLDGKLEGFTQGADDYISKPFQPLELKARIHNLLLKSELQKDKNHRLFQLQKELILARDIQSKLLPTELPAIAGFSFASLYIPLDEVGGDFYDIFEMDDRVFFFLCDVSGHGVPACLIASMVKMAFQSEIQGEKSITKIMQGINKSLFTIIGNNFVTAMIAELNLNTRTIQYTTAGHPPFYHVTKDSILELSTQGKPLGVFADVEFQSKQISPNDGDLIFFYTDGIVESANAEQEFYGEERLENYLKRSKHLEPQDIIEALKEELKGFLGGEKFEDDITALALRFQSNHVPIGLK
jgi:two-component system sensor histidine kinase ChiS